MRLSCLLLGCFFSLCIFAESSEKTYGNIEEAQGHAIKAPRSMMGVDADHSVGVSVDGEAREERCLSPDTTFEDVGSSLSLEFTEPKPLLPAEDTGIYIQDGKIIPSKNYQNKNKLDSNKPYCSLGIDFEHHSKSMQLLEGPIKVNGSGNKSRNPNYISLETPFNILMCFKTIREPIYLKDILINYKTIEKPISMRDLRISEFKEIVGNAIKVNINCSKLSASKSKK